MNTETNRTETEREGEGEHEAGEIILKSLFLNL